MLIAVFPLLAGLLFRWLLRRRRRGWILTAAAALLALILFLWAITIPIPGSEGPGLRAIQAIGRRSHGTAAVAETTPVNGKRPCPHGHGRLVCLLDISQISRVGL